MNCYRSCTPLRTSQDETAEFLLRYRNLDVGHLSLRSTQAGKTRWPNLKIDPLEAVHLPYKSPLIITDQRAFALYNKKVPRTGLEPVRAISPRDFKSLVSTNSTISAQDEKK